MPNVSQGSSSKTVSVNRVTQMTNIFEIKQGFTAPLVFSLERGVFFDDEAVPVRYVDNLRLALDAVAAEASSGHTIVLNDVATIHFAQWAILPGERQMLFTASFDGGFEQYIHDFVTMANSGKPTPQNGTGTKWMDIIWTNCVGYSGTDDFQAFLDFIEDYAIRPTLFFPTISDASVRDISWLRQFRKQFATFDEAALRVDRTTWPPDLLHAYDQLKTNLNRIDLTNV